MPRIGLSLGLDAAASAPAPGDVPQDMSASMSQSFTSAGNLTLFDPIIDESGCVLEIDFDTGSPTTTTASVANGDDFGNASWTKNETTVSTDQDGVADRISVNAAATSPYVSSALTTVQSSSTQVPLILTIKAKYESVQWLCIESRAGTAANQTFFDIQNGTVGANGASHSGGSISAADGSGYRTISIQVDANAGTNIFRVYCSTTNTTVTAPGSGSTVLVKNATATQTRLSAVNNRKTAVSWSQGTNSLQCGLDATGLGGKACAHFYGSQFFSSTEAAVFGALGTDPAFFAIFVLQFTNPDSTQIYFGSANSGQANRIRGFGTNTTGTGVHRAYLVDDAAVNSSVEAAGNMANGTSNKVVEWHGDGTHISCQDNGGTADPNAAAQDGGTLTVNQTGVGARVDNSADSFFIGKLAIAALWNVEKDSTSRSRIRQYYAGKRGITVTP